jgi:hypothetical protein
MPFQPKPGLYHGSYKQMKEHIKNSCKLVPKKYNRLALEAAMYQDFIKHIKDDNRN